MEAETIQNRHGDVEARLVVFRLEDREYALPVEHVGEILRMVALTPLPDAPAWLGGVLSLRGRVVPVVDLRARFGLPALDVGLDTPIVIVQAGERVAGVIVDAVEEVLPLPPGSLSAPEEPAEASGPIVSVVATGDRVILVLEAEALIAGSQRSVPAEI